MLSKQFNITRGTKQGDPLSSLLFNALLEDIFRRVQPRWVQERLGLQLGHAKISMVTGLRFADDVLLVSTSLSHLTSMLADVDTESRKHGLQVHPDKTKIMWNGYDRGTQIKEIRYQ